MRKYQREIKRDFLSKILPGNKPKDTGSGMRMLTSEPGFKQWRQDLQKNAKIWIKKQWKPFKFVGLV